MRELILDLRYLYFPEDGGPWWHQPGRLETILRCTAEAGLGIDLSFHHDDSGRVQRIGSLAALLKESASWDEGGHVFSVGEGPDAPAELDLTLSDPQQRLMLVLRAAHVAEHPDCLDRIVDLVARLHEELGPTVFFGRNLAVRATGIDHPRPLPPRTPDGWPMGTLVDFHSRTYHEQHERGRPEDLERLLAAPLPGGARREERGDLVVLRFAESLEPEEIVAGCARQERWISRVLDLPLAGGFNDLGDALETRLNLAPHEPLTYYDAGQGHGYKATVVWAGGQVDEELFAELTGWLKAGQLPDGTPLQALHLIVQNREAALWVRPRATRAGIQDVLYIGEGNQLWNPTPPGLWLPPEA